MLLCSLTKTMPTFFLVLFVAVVLINDSSSSRIKIVNNGYEDILIALPKEFPSKNRYQLIVSLKDLLQQSSSLLNQVTKSGAKFHSASFLVPEEWEDEDTWLHDRDKSIVLEEPNAVFRREKADIVVTNPSEAEHPYTAHHRGCGEQSLRIYLPANFPIRGNLQKRSVEFIRLWSEFRYGVFPEGGFQDDEKFPLTYQIPGEDKNRTTDCVNMPFRVPEECDAAWDCDKNKIFPSIMDQHYTNATAFCEGHSGLGLIHNPETPTKQNLLCNEEGTYFTLLRSSDFKDGRNAAPRHQNRTEISFRYLKESAGRVFIVIDTSSEMNFQDRFLATKSAFSHFILHDLPGGTKLSLLTFEGRETNAVTSDILISDENSRNAYLESEPLPDEPSEVVSSCPSCALMDILELLRNRTGPAPQIILITTNQIMNDSNYRSIFKDLKILEISLHVLMFPSTSAEHLSKNNQWYTLCKETDNSFLYLSGNLFGNMYKGFTSVIHGTSKKELIIQTYLNTLDEETLFLPIRVDDSLTKNLVVSLTGPNFGSSPLKYTSTELRCPDRTVTNPQKQELIPQWTFRISDPKPGICTLKTWRKRGVTSPILVTVTGQSSENDSISARVWIETKEFKYYQPPIQIFAEVRRGSYPIINATVIAYVHHPKSKRVSKIIMLDDGIGNTDITKDDGIYSHFFTNFTLTGFYNVHLVVTNGEEDFAAVLKGPSSHCCGSSFPFHELAPLTPFRRETGPVTFEVTSIPKYDLYPPSKVTDLRIILSFDLMFVLQWTAVGDDYDAGVADRYEIKVFRDRSLIRNRYFGSDQEIFNATVETIEEATYGTTLYHTLTFSHPPESGLYQIGIRAYDDAGNHGDLSNVVAVFIESKTSNRRINCVSQPLPLTGGFASRTSPLLTLYLFFIFVIKFYSSLL